jgi:hypothetical protein
VLSAWFRRDFAVCVSLPRWITPRASEIWCNMREKHRKNAPQTPKPISARFDRTFELFRAFFPLLCPFVHCHLCFLAYPTVPSG